MADRSANILDQHQLRKTQARQEVLDILLRSEGKALSSAEIEQQLEEADRITLYRTLRTFEQKGIIHLAVDGSNLTRYAICHAECDEHDHRDDHAHFHCTACGTTFCLDSEVKISYSTPKGFQVDDQHLVLNGLCPECRPSS